MKKSKIYLLMLVVLCISISTFISCSEENKTPTSSSSELRQPNVGEIKFLENSQLAASNRNETGKVMLVEIARRRHSPDPTVCGDCVCGWGVCRWCFFCEKTSDPKSHIMKIYEENGKEFIEIQLAEPKITGVDYNFYIDNDVFADDNSNFYFARSTYPLDLSIGLYGGYKIFIKQR